MRNPHISYSLPLTKEARYLFNTNPKTETKVDVPAVKRCRNCTCLQSEDSESGGGVAVTCYLVSPSGFRALVGWLSAAVAANAALGVASLWSCYANHFLHWGAIATWALLLTQGRGPQQTLVIKLTPSMDP